MKNFLTIALVLLCVFEVKSQIKSRKDYLITLTTNMGTAHIVLYDETPLHKANFIRLAKTKFYDSLLFHRVIQNFMIQGGDPNSKTAKPGSKLGGGGADLPKIPFEYSSKRIHSKGALAAARDGNAAKMSSGCQFYIVQGKKLSADELSKVEKANNLTYTEAQKNEYITSGGTAFLDNKYTVFGEVIDNLTLIEDIVNASKDDSDRPEKDIVMKIKAKKLRKKKITRIYKYKFD